MPGTRALHFQALHGSIFIGRVYLYHNTAAGRVRSVEHRDSDFSEAIWHGSIIQVSVDTKITQVLFCFAVCFCFTLLLCFVALSLCRFVALLVALLGFVLVYRFALLFGGFVCDPAPLAALPYFSKHDLLSLGLSAF